MDCGLRTEDCEVWIAFWPWDLCLPVPGAALFDAGIIRQMDLPTRRKVRNRPSVGPKAPYKYWRVPREIVILLALPLCKLYTACKKRLEFRAWDMGFGVRGT